MSARWLILFLLLPLVVHGQALCIGATNREDCQRKVEEGQAGKIAERGGSIIATKNTGEGSIASSGTPKSINDFLPLLSAIVDTGGLGGDNDQAIQLEWSNFLGLPPEHQTKLTAAATSSSIYEPLQEALRAADLAASVNSLEDGIDSSDDVTIAFSYSLASSRQGRDPSLQHDIFKALLQSASEQSDEPSEALRATEKRRQDLERELGLSNAFDGPFTSIAQLRRQEYIAAVEAEHTAEYGDMASLLGKLQNNGFYGLLDLVNNQPQLTFSTHYRSRDEAIGPDEFRAVVSYEVGWYNVNTFRNHAKQSCSFEGESGCLTGYLSKVRKHLSSSPRVAITAEYVKRPKLSFTLPANAFLYVEQAREAFKLNAAYGRYLGGENVDKTRTRLELALSYEDVSDDPNRQDRGLASASVSYPVARGFYLSIGAVYATKPEFRGDVDKEISAHAGFTYKVVRVEE
jgi:hypothetical protein